MDGYYNKYIKTALFQGYTNRLYNFNSGNREDGKWFVEPGRKKKYCALYEINSNFN